jgi:hypothetical protein
MICINILILENEPGYLRHNLPLVLVKQVLGF